MHDLRTKLLIVDDDESIRTSLSHTLIELGYAVQTAEDGNSALSFMCKEAPDILLTDLNMPGTSGFELLNLVSRWFPEVSTVAMSGAFSGHEVPSGVAANAFYQKGSSLGALVRILESLPKAVRLFPQFAASETPANSFRRAIHNPDEEQCPTCRRTFLQFLNGREYEMRESTCPDCGTPVSFVFPEIVNLDNRTPELQSRSLHIQGSYGAHDLN